MIFLAVGLAPFAVAGLLAAGLIFRTGAEAAAPCPRCGGQRWRTVIKGREWACRRCGQVRRVELAEVVPINSRLSLD